VGTAPPVSRAFCLSPSSKQELRQYYVGYRYLENKMPVIPPVKDTARISRPLQVNLAKRPVARVSAGCHVKNACRPVPCKLDPNTAVAGAWHRFLRKPPPSSPALMEEFRLFVKKEVQKRFVPLAIDADVSVERWLKNTDYPDWRRKELQVQWDGVHSMWDEDKSHRYFRCSSFVKDEDYPEYKHARAINSRSDVFKCAVGPIFKLMEEVVYKDPSFIKHVPVADRPQYIMDRLHRVGAKYLATDFTSFEALFTKEMMDSCEFVLYEHMTQYLPSRDEFMRLITDVVGGTTLCKFKTFSVEVEATRMSGEMCTSLGNGFSNLMFMLFLCKKKGCKNVVGVVEGDDGLFTMDGIPPSTADFSELGLIIKCDVHDDISTASFCGLIFDPTDRVNVTDPLKVIVNFAWISAQYRSARDYKLRMLLRCKAMSLAHQYPGCPILSALARYGLRCTPIRDSGRLLKVIGQKGLLSSFQMSEFRSAILFGKIPNKEVPMNTRLLVERQFGFSVEAQLSLEKYLDGLNELQPLDHWTLDAATPQLWLNNFDNYAFQAHRTDKQLDFMPRYYPSTGQSVEWDEKGMPANISNRREWSSERLYGRHGEAVLTKALSAFNNSLEA
jgi:hypothetical protein